MLCLRKPRSYCLSFQNNTTSFRMHIISTTCGASCPPLTFYYSLFLNLSLQIWGISILSKHFKVEIFLLDIIRIWQNQMNAFMIVLPASSQRYILFESLHPIPLIVVQHVMFFQNIRPFILRYAVSSLRFTFINIDTHLNFSRLPYLEINEHHQRTVPIRIEK